MSEDNSGPYPIFLQRCPWHNKEALFRFTSRPWLTRHASSLALTFRSTPWRGSSKIHLQARVTLKVEWTVPRPWRIPAWTVPVPTLLASLASLCTVFTAASGKDSHKTMKSNTDEENSKHNLTVIRKCNAPGKTPRFLRNLFKYCLEVENNA